jgi:hypothetical protein
VGKDKEAPLAQSSNTIYISGTKPFIFLVSFGKPNLRFIFIKSCIITQTVFFLTGLKPNRLVLVTKYPDKFKVFCFAIEANLTKSN